MINPQRDRAHLVQLILSVFMLSLSVPSSSGAQLHVGSDALDMCSKIEGFRKSGEKTEARDAARRCLEGLERELEGEVGAFFLKEVAGWERTRFEQNNALGMRNVSAAYAKGGKTIRVSLLGGSGGGGGLAGALGGMARMGMMGNSQREVSVAGLPTSILPDGQMMVTLTDGSFITFECSAFSTPDTALDGMGEFINAFPVKDIDRVLGGG